ncbi:MAG: TolC family protein [bacterium]
MTPTRHHRHAYWRLVLTLAMAGTGLGVCADNAACAWPAPRALGRELPANRGDLATAPPATTPSEPTGVLTLRQALALALRHSLELAASAHGVRAAEGNARQAGTWPNPEVEIGAEEFGGSDSRKGYGAAQTSVGLNQPVELGGKRGKRQRVAQSEARLAGWAYEAQRLDVHTRTQKAFVDVLLAQGQGALAESLLAVTEEVRQAAVARVKGGKVPRLEETKAGVEVTAARIARDRTRRELETARQQLVAAWGGTVPGFTAASGNLDAVSELPPLKALAAALDDAPEVARWHEEVTLGQAALTLAQAERLPTLGVSAGISRFEEDGSYAGTVGLSVPLPLFDRKVDGMLAAQHRITRAEYEQRAARLRAMTALNEAHSRLETARGEALAIQAELLPGVQQAFAAAQTEYQAGKVRYLEVLDAQRTLHETHARCLDVLAAYQKAAADVERLTGIPLNTIQ